MQIRKVLTYIQNFFTKLWRGLVRWWHKAWWTKAITIFIATLIILLLGLYGIARWYVASNASKPLELGVTFIPDYARSLDLDAEQTMDAIIDDLDVKHFRLVSYWNKHEIEQGNYDFSDLDWQFEKAEKANAKISLALGLRQPRWPECHIPGWAMSQSSRDRQVALEKYIGVVIDRYKDSPSLESYQLENEALLKNFGECPETNRGWLESEAKLVKKHDNKHPLIMSRSNNYPSLSLGKPRPDLIGVSVYRRVWNENIYKGYYNYPLPSWYYAGIAGLQKIVTGKDSVLHEMQMEPWPPSGKFVKDVPLKEQDESMSPAMFKDRVDFAKNTGMRSIDLWGAEWWYWRMEKAHDSDVWEEAKKVFESN